MIAADLGAHARGGFTTRAGGVSRGPYAALNLGGAVGDEVEAVRTNRSILADLAGAPVRFAHQVHGTRVLSCDPPLAAGDDPDELPADAVLTGAPEYPVGVLVADCVPVLLAGVSAVAAVHAGRRGLLDGVIGAALAAMAARGSPVSHAAIGPAICGRCYEVPEQMRAEAAAGNAALDSRTSWGTPALDLPAGVARELSRGGVAHIDRLEMCTLEDDRFFSYRRAPVTGRFAGIAIRTR